MRIVGNWEPTTKTVLLLSFLHFFYRLRYQEVGLSSGGQSRQRDENPVCWRFTTAGIAADQTLEKGVVFIFNVLCLDCVVELKILCSTLTATGYSLQICSPYTLRYAVNWILEGDPWPEKICRVLVVGVLMCVIWMDAQPINWWRQPWGKWWLRPGCVSCLQGDLWGEIVGGGCSNGETRLQNVHILQSLRGRLKEKRKVRVTLETSSEYICVHRCVNTCVYWSVNRI